LAKTIGRRVKEELNEATVQYVGVVWDPLKPWISCQDGKSLRRVKNGRYDFQIITFQNLKNATKIAETVTIGWREHLQ
jgi:hypothetical protein